MYEQTAFCGINCLECEGYKATQANDLAWLEATLAKWQVEYNNPSMTSGERHLRRLQGRRGPPGRLLPRMPHTRLRGFQGCGDLRALQRIRELPAPGRVLQVCPCPQKQSGGHSSRLVETHDKRPGLAAGWGNARVEDQAAREEVLSGSILQNFHFSFAHFL